MSDFVNKSLKWWIYILPGSAVIACCIAYDLMPMLPGTEMPIPVILFFLYMLLPIYIDYKRSRRGLRKSKP